jgi:ABC-type polysaccharide/polyol phosphate export permease
MLRSVWSHRDLLVSLVRRQFQVRYRQSFVGFAWALLPALATLGVGAILFKGVLNVGTGGVNYSVFAMSALIPWTFLANSMPQGVTSVAQNLAIVTRLAFPRAVLPLSIVGLSFLDLLVAAVAFVVIALVTGSGLPATAAWAPLLLLLEIPLIVGVILLGAALNVFARDIKLAVPLVVQLWLFLTPVMYALPTEPGLRGFYLANPMTGLVVSFRRVLVFGRPPDLDLLLPTIIGAIGFFVVGWWYFRSTEPRFADVI